MKLRPFPPCELEPDWALTRYYGWRDLERREDGALLERRVGPIRRRLLLLHGAPAGWVDELARRHRLLSPMATLTIQDFAREPADGPRILRGRALARGDGRWFGAGTFFYELSEPEAALRKRFPKGKLNHAKKVGLDVDVSARPDDAAISQVLALYAELAAEKGLPPLDARQLRAMSDAGHAALVRGRIAGRTAAVLWVYTLPRHGYFLHAARASDAPRGVADVLHWEAILHLKATGRRWYDLGLVPSTSPDDGLYTFKQRLGGEYCSSGVEHAHRPAWLDAAWEPLRAARGRVLRALSRAPR
ncbi:MAG: GNAT family N-acetyltransferase [Polyangiaceae bacterium]|nr:GNAT family N-acetyltransferase [Polyangiaceae bacterium]